MSSSEKTLTLNDLKDGDVLVMQGPKSWHPLSLHMALDQAIMWLTNSNVTHGALYYGVEGGTHFLIDDGQQGVQQHTMTHEGGEAVDWYVRRLKSESSLEPVLKIANKFKGASTAYDWELLVMVGFLLLFKKMTSNSIYNELLLKLLQKMVVYFDNHTHKAGTRYFICSQFVATCFYDAGSDYKLDVVNGNILTQSLGDAHSVIDYCSANSHMLSQQPQALAEGEINEPTAEDIKSLIEAYEEQPVAALESESPEMLGQLVSVSNDFLKLFFEINANALGLKPEDCNTPEKRFALAKKYQVDFVTPADLKSHCANLEDIGIISFVYGY